MISTKRNEPNIEDPRFRITPIQQMAAACTGALITSTFGILLISNYILFKILHCYNMNQIIFSYSIGCYKSTPTSSIQNNSST